MIASNNNSLGKWNIVFILILLISIMAGCSDSRGNNTTDYGETGFYASIPGNYDSADTAIIMNINNQESTMTFLTMAIGKKYTLNFDGATTFADKYGQALTLQQIRPGDLVDVTFMKGKKRLNSLKMAEGAFFLNNVKDFEIFNDGRKIRVGREEYTISEDVIIMLSKGQGEMLDINNVDTLCLMGFDRTVKSIVVEQGHGYLRLVNDSFFVDGFIEINQEKVYVISSDMLLAVPAGSVMVAVSNSGCLGYTTIEVPEGGEYELDVSVWQGKPQTGDIIFTIDPATAKVSIDGKNVDISQPVNLEYGIHHMVIKSDGYETINKYIKVGTASANVDITMEEESDDTASQNNVNNNSVSNNSSASQNTASANTASSNSASSNSVSDNWGTTLDTAPVIQPPANTVSENAAVSDNTINPDNVISIDGEGKVYVDAPGGVELYVDGIYIGITPTSFKKKTGTITVTLKKTGFQTRNYTLEIKDPDEDENYSFPELVEL